MTINDGGPAFPAVGVPPWADQKSEKLERLRDWFAGQALAGMMVPRYESDRAWHSNPEDVAGLAYTVADAMLRARGVEP
jgi:hypothetical protein